MQPFLPLLSRLEVASGEAVRLGAPDALRDELAQVAADLSALVDAPRTPSDEWPPIVALSLLVLRDWHQWKAALQHR